MCEICKELGYMSEFHLTDDIWTIPQKLKTQLIIYMCYCNINKISNIYDIFIEEEDDYINFVVEIYKREHQSYYLKYDCYYFDKSMTLKDIYYHLDNMNNYWHLETEQFKS